MAKEIERKFLVDRYAWKDYSLSCEGRNIEQAYISERPEATVRLRIADGTDAWLTVKGLNSGVERHEWEIAVDVADARDMMDNLPVSGYLSKTRYYYGRWEIDIYHGLLEGLATAEIELESAAEPVDIPPFVIREVSDDPRYYNSMLAIITDREKLPPFV